MLLRACLICLCAVVSCGRVRVLEDHSPHGAAGGGYGDAAAAEAGEDGGQSEDGGQTAEGGQSGEGGGQGGAAGIIAGAGGSVAGSSGNEGGPCFGAEEQDITCPDAVGPFSGACAPKGTCCKRSSNTVKNAAFESSEPLELEYRVTQAIAINHPLSISLPILHMAAGERARTCAGDQCWLWRFVQPREAGALVAGKGSSELGVGRYNCDGTYSYFGDTVAPERPEVGFTDPARWATRAAETFVDPSASGVARTRSTWSSDPSQRLTCMPYFLPGTQTIDFEQCSSGFEILQFDTSQAGEDCQGGWTGASWETPGRFQLFVPLAANDRDAIDAIGQSFCQLLSFSVLPPDERDIDCLTVPRCAPGAGGCPYVKLPDSLCPETDEERGTFRCHLGAQGNPNDEQDYPTELHCTDGAPGSPLDPGLDPSVSKGQCCDPLGARTEGLPACNAFRVVYDYAASAAEITADRSNELPPVCL